MYTIKGASHPAVIVGLTMLEHFIHDDVIKWKHFLCYWPYVRGIHWAPVDSPHKSQWRGALMLTLSCAWTNSWANNLDAGDFRRHRAHYDVTVMCSKVFVNYLTIGRTDMKSMGVLPSNQLHWIWLRAREPWEYSQKWPSGRHPIFIRLWELCFPEIVTAQALAFAINIQSELDEPPC